MKRLVVVALAIAIGSCGPARPGPVSAKLPADSKLYDGDTTFVAIERYKGRVVVLDFWAGWCGECKRTIPQVQRLAAAFASEGLLVVGVNAGEKQAEATRYAKEFGIEYPIALDPDLELSDRLGGGRLPLLIVVDRDGTIVHRAKHVDEETLRVVRKLLRSQASAAP